MTRSVVVSSNVVVALGMAAAVVASGEAHAFCGFFVAKADAKLFNKSSQIVLVRDGDKTVITMASDYQGKVKDFAMVVPVPTELKKEQIHIAEMKLVDHLDAFTVPRLVEYTDDDPCAPRYYLEDDVSTTDEGGGGGGGGGRMSAAARAKVLGVTIEQSYSVGEYDILVLSGKQSDGLITWLTEQGYKIPDGAAGVVDSYLKQKMHWFVAKVNLAKHDAMGGGDLRPIQMAYESPKFMLPIRLGTVNAQGPQDAIVYAISKTGRVESTNYKTVRLPSDLNVPEYTKDVFGEFYKAAFATAVAQNQMKAVITEYAWDMSFCDPCAADPLSADELRGLGVWWTEGAYVTRLHARYDAAHFPEDLVFQVTSDRENFQGRYIMQHPFKGEMKCPAAAAYKKQVGERRKLEAKNMAELTGWTLADIEKRMGR